MFQHKGVPLLKHMLFLFSVLGYNWKGKKEPTKREATNRLHKVVGGTDRYFQLVQDINKGMGWSEFKKVN
jgi:hypothetical protein